MDKKSLLPGEKIVMSSDDDMLVLTTTRIRLDVQTLGRATLRSATLDAVSCCGLVTRSYPLLLVGGAILLIAAFGMNLRGQEQLVAIVVALVLVAAYFATRRSLLTITTTGGAEIAAPARGMSHESLVEFVDAVETEKLRFMARHEARAAAAAAAAK